MSIWNITLQMLIPIDIIDMQEKVVEFAIKIQKNPYINLRGSHAEIYSLHEVSINSFVSESFCNNNASQLRKDMEAHSSILYCIYCTKLRNYLLLHMRQLHSSIYWVHLLFLYLHHILLYNISHILFDVILGIESQPRRFVAHIEISSLIVPQVLGAHVWQLVDMCVITRVIWAHVH